MQGVVQLPVAGPGQTTALDVVGKDFSIGAPPQCEANADTDRNRVPAPQQVRIFAARTSQMPCISVSVVPDTATGNVAVASAMRRSSRHASVTRLTVTRRTERAGTVLGRMLRSAPAAASAFNHRGIPAEMS